VGLRPLAFWHLGFEFRRGHGRLSVVSVVCCQVSTTDQLFIQTSPTECGVSNKCDREDSLGQDTTQDRVAALEDKNII